MQNQGNLFLKVLTVVMLAQTNGGFKSRSDYSKKSQIDWTNLVFDIKIRVIISPKTKDL